MSTRMIGKGNIVFALIDAKRKIYQENFVSMNEWVRFNHFMQKTFNDRNMGVVITSDILDPNDFENHNGVVTLKNASEYQYKQQLPEDIVKVLYDDGLRINFLMRLEDDKMKQLNTFTEEKKILQKSNKNEYQKISK